MSHKHNVKIIVATHKRYEMPTEAMYVPLHVGAEGKFNPDGTPLDFGYTKDNTGDNVSARNLCLGTQTGLYWMWKNLKADYLGLVHYRRYFLRKGAGKRSGLKGILTQDELETMLDTYKVFVPVKRNYRIETMYSHYAHTLDARQLDMAREIIARDTPEYLNAFDTVMKRTWAHMFNLMIMRSDLLDDYCRWLFNVLFQLEKGIDTTGMTDFEKRFGGRVSELLLNVWLERKIETGQVKPSEIKELPYSEEVNWARKIASFLGAKFFHKKYQKSF